MIIDTHCHYNLEPLLENFTTEWHEAQKNNVQAAIIIGTDINNSNIALQRASTNDNLFVAVGLHPGNYTEFISHNLVGDNFNQEVIDQKIKQDLSEIQTLLTAEITQKNPKLVAIGEIGLDYYRLKKKGLKRELVVQMQKQILKAQLELALKYNLVVILHVRDQLERQKDNAYFDTLEIVKAVFTEQQKQVTFILHCASGPMTYIDEAVKLGGYIGVAGNVTYDNAPEIRAIVQHVSNDRLLLETDAPYLAPSEHKGEICHPAYINLTADFLKNKMSINLDIIKENTFKVFPQIAEEFKHGQ